ncbi:uncharacterized protein B0I36DRAFT_50516 [Microdochium trichocladiopsis]|uniref:Uncharacterized protein n=1 Tax=Microdochium trichocladiopsis TaxID=1682393 RepID=A0A9P9BLZ7_9PEZI|nr:uncharacterized protein B0I36DRAFT_50516 [Microdochium trichocladiopsis]KAH7014582.1 hypothetical protein B0I36DRAFT_50516 [Microdochium trichocladiopsis]
MYDCGTKNIRNCTRSPAYKLSSAKEATLRIGTPSITRFCACSLSLEISVSFQCFKRCVEARSRCIYLLFPSCHGEKRSCRCVKPG